MVNRGVHYESHGVICMPQCFQIMFHAALVLFNALDSRFLVSMPAAVQTVVHVVIVTTAPRQKRPSAKINQHFRMVVYAYLSIYKCIYIYKGTTCPTKNGFFASSTHVLCDGRIHPFRTGFVSADHL